MARVFLIPCQGWPKSSVVYVIASGRVIQKRLLISNVLLESFARRVSRWVFPSKCRAASAT